MADAPPGLPRDYLTLFEATASEAKRMMSDAPGISHLAVALARKEPNSFDDAFGEGAAERLIARARPGVPFSSLAGDLGGFLQEAAQQQVEREALPALLQSTYDLSALLGDHEPGPSGADTAGAEGRDARAGDAAREHTSPGSERGGADIEQAAAEASPQSVLARTSRYVEVADPSEEIIGRDSIVDEVLARIGRFRPMGCLVSGPSGSGKSAVVDALAARLSQPDYHGPLAGAQVLRVSPELLLMGDTALLLKQIIEDAANSEATVVLAIDDLEVVAAFGADGRADVGVLRAIRAAVGLKQIPLLLLADSQFAGRLRSHDTELFEELETVQLNVPGREVLEHITATHMARLSDQHRVEFPEHVSRLALSSVSQSEVGAHPGVALRRLDRAAVLASLRPDRTVGNEDFVLDADPATSQLDPSRLATSLGDRVVGQDVAVGRVANRLTLTRAKLDLRPERPDGVFLFVGPSGVGKTQLAKAIALETLGDEQRMLRLDMSEYAAEWSISKLTGPPPGYVGSTDPEAWLTTKVRERPDLVLLLDEVEKAHPQVWNLFLQVFDAGRLTDAHGRTADFSQTIVVMTSNLGAQAFNAPAVGFGTQNAPVANEARVLEAVRSALAPELINRLDDVIVFQPLPQDSIAAIAAHEVDRVLSRLRERGYDLEVEPEVVEYLATTGYDPAYGARHLQRNIERLLLQPLAHTSELSLRASLEQSTVSWHAKHSKSEA